MKPNRRSAPPAPEAPVAVVLHRRVEDLSRAEVVSHALRIANLVRSNTVTFKATKEGNRQHERDAAGCFDALHAAASRSDLAGISAACKGLHRAMKHHRFSTLEFRSANNGDARIVAEEPHGLGQRADYLIAHPNEGNPPVAAAQQFDRRRVAIG